MHGCENTVEFYCISAIKYPTVYKGMKKKLAISIAALAVLAVLALAVLQGRLSREVILKRNGLPLANLKGGFLPLHRAASVSTSTDANGRLDLSGLPWGTDLIIVDLRDDTTAVFNGLVITLPKSGSHTIDFRGSRTISTTKWTYFFGFFTWQEVQDCVEAKNTDSVSSKAPTREPLSDGGAKPTASPSSRPGS